MLCNQMAWAVLNLWILLINRLNKCKSGISVCLPEDLIFRTSLTFKVFSATYFIKACNRFSTVWQWLKHNEPQWLKHNETQWLKHNETQWLKHNEINWVMSWENLFYAISKQQRCRSACTSVQSDQHLCCLHFRAVWSASSLFIA